MHCQKKISCSQLSENVIINKKILLNKLKLKIMRKARFEFSEVALSQVEQVYETIKRLVKSNLYDSLYNVLNNTTLSAKQYRQLQTLKHF